LHAASSIRSLHLPIAISFSLLIFLSLLRDIVVVPKGYLFNPLEGIYTFLCQTIILSLKYRKQADYEREKIVPAIFFIPTPPYYLQG
jgi:hypothetical protein